MNNVIFLPELTGQCAGVGVMIVGAIVLGGVDGASVDGAGVDGVVVVGAAVAVLVATVQTGVDHNMVKPGKTSN